MRREVRSPGGRGIVGGIAAVVLAFTAGCGSPGSWERDDGGDVGIGDPGRDAGRQDVVDWKGDPAWTDADDPGSGDGNGGDRQDEALDPGDAGASDGGPEGLADPGLPEDPGEAPGDPGSPDDPGADPGLPPPPPRATRSEVRDAVRNCQSPEELTRFLGERYDGPACDDTGCTLIVDPGADAVSLRGEFNAWGQTPMTAVACRPGTFWADVPPVPGDRDAWQYRLFAGGAWMDDGRNRWIRFTDISINHAMHRPGTPRIARLQGIASTALPEPREAYVYVPAEAFGDPARRFPVMLLQDGWNVFDNPRAPYGSWLVDRTARELAASGAIEPVILVGVTTANRIDEYLYTDFWVTGTGNPVQVHPKLPAYADLLVDVVLPRVRREFPARTGPRDTAIGGSSLGGISAFWIAWMHADVFGKVAALSPSFWVGEAGSGTEEKPSMREVMAQAPPTAAQRALKVYLDSGDGGYSPGGGDDPAYAWDGRAYTDWTRNALIRLGWSNRPEWDTDGDPATAPADFPLDADPATVPALAWSPAVPPGYADWDAFLRPDRDLLCLLGVGQVHNEAAWSARFPAALRFLFPPR
ncbi:hypothetical protein KBD49_14210 [Myxococcota bacterium]|nr:hypothetical protein [Myxococcota bacterium]